MKGFIRQRGDAWERGLCRRRPGHRQAAVCVTNRARRQARNATRAQRDDHRGRARLSVRRRATVGELLEAWFELASGDFSPSTVKETRGFNDRNLLPTLGSVQLSRLKASDLDKSCTADGRRWSWRPSAVAGDRATHPRHLVPCTRAGRQVGLARREPGSVDHTTKSATTADRPTVERGVGPRTEACCGGVARVGVLPPRRSRHRRASL